MKEYLLFVDTETSGLPLDWEKPYSAEGNWPYIVQLAWIVYTADAREVKRENHFIKPHDYKISEISRQIHGISDQFLLEHGKERKEVMQRLWEDLVQYQPLVVAHFMQLDYHMLGLGFYRAGLENPLEGLPTFCTMKITRDFMLVPERKYLRLPELYERLFNTPLKQEHNALVDAEATARCFFEMQKRGDVNPAVIAGQGQVFKPNPRKIRYKQGVFLLLALLLLTIILILTNWLA